jgi:hypothetical protein
VSEDVIGTLGRFTPTQPDRDAILFAAGRASAKPSTRWKWLAAALVVSQSGTLALGLWLWPRSAAVPERPDSPPPVAAPEPVPIPSFDPSSIYVLSRDPERLSRSIAGATGPGRPTLSAFSRELSP